MLSYFFYHWWYFNWGGGRPPWPPPVYAYDKRDSTQRGRGRAEIVSEKLKPWLAWQKCRQNWQAWRIFILSQDFASLAARELCFSVVFTVYQLSNCNLRAPPDNTLCLQPWLIVYHKESQPRFSKRWRLIILVIEMTWNFVRTKIFYATNEKQKTHKCSKKPTLR